MRGVEGHFITANHTARQGARRGGGISRVSPMPPAGAGSPDLGGMGRDWPGDPRIRGRYGRILSVVEGGVPWREAMRPIPGVPEIQGFFSGCAWK